MNRVAIVAFTIVFALASMALGGKVRADESNRARALVLECKTDENACKEYLLGVWDAILMAQELHHRHDIVCPTTGPSGGQLLAAFDKWVGENPEKLGQVSRVVGAVLAFKHQWPC